MWYSSFSVLPNPPAHTKNTKQQKQPTTQPLLLSDRHHYWLPTTSHASRMSSLIMNRSSLGQWCCSKQSTCFIILNICVTSIFFLQYVLHSNGDARDNLLLTNYTHDSHRHLKANKKVLQPRDYTYIIIHYHKTGHDLTRSIVDMISGGIQGVSKPTVWTRRTMLSTFNKDTRVCTDLFVL